MKRVRNNILLKGLLVFLFIGFYVWNTAFVHTHNYYYYSVTHSHPFSKTADGTPDHTHDKAALDTIAQFNSFSVDRIVLLLSLGVFSILLFTFIARQRFEVILRTVDRCSLRDPPVCL